MADTVSIIVNSKDELRYALFLERFVRRLTLDNVEVIRVNDASSMSEGYNRGARIAKGSWFIFCHDDIAILNGNSGKELKRGMRCSDVFGVCGTTRVVSGNWYDGGVPYNAGAVVAPDPSRSGSYRLELFGVKSGKIIGDIQALDGLFIMCKRDVYYSVGRFDEELYTGFHTYDIDFSFRSYLKGYKCSVLNNLLLLHDSDVSKFSKEKIESWNKGQELFVEKYRDYINGQPGERMHYNLSLNTPESGMVMKKVYVMALFMGLKK